jgi:hypothetical protein
MSRRALLSPRQLSVPPAGLRQRCSFRNASNTEGAGYPNHATYANLTATGFQQKLDELWAGGFRPVRIAAYATPAGKRDAAIREKVPGSWAQRFGLTPAAYRRSTSRGRSRA